MFMICTAMRMYKKVIYFESAVSYFDLLVVYFESAV
ncbi:hypothetical protein SAMN05421780_101708 [Flexibacter flexilis DSM 6793]|uniref:Uncharacterized protein n=1 Tax=Flexibacter flexilis DSM 6793 TaxID=927664 RepID=A0A1I1EG55_9BACT|nr:hypothetical protein SAMN05421780_101708 [Flexibacter flexilis DSM 6793]